MFIKLNIGQRLGAGFTLLVALMVLLVIIGLVGMKKIRTELDIVVGENNVRAVTANEMVEQVRNVAITIRNILLTTDQAFVGAEVDSVKERRAIYNKDFEKLVLMIPKEDSQAWALIQKVKEAQAIAGPLTNKVIDLGLDGRDKEAAEIMIKETGPAVGDLIDALQTLADFQQYETELAYQSAQVTYKKAQIILLAIAAVAILIAIIAATVLRRGIIRPLNAGVDAAGMIARGDLTLKIDGGGTDEIGLLMRSMKDMADKLRGIIGQIKAVSVSLNDASTHLSGKSEQISETTSSQSSRSTQIATSAEELTQTVIDVARNASSIADSAKSTVEKAQEGDRIVEASVKEIREIATAVSGTSKVLESLHERSKQIGEIVKVINDIADQTNLLALNAAIEAARAGEQGRGFAVVADEVRKLAERTARATSEIGGMITSIQREVDESVGSMKGAITKVDTGVQLSTRAGQQLKEIVSSISDLQGLVQQIASATEEMSAVAEGIGSDISSIAESSNDLSSGTIEIARSSSELAQIASTLKHTMDGFKI